MKVLVFCSSSLLPEVCIFMPNPLHFQIYDYVLRHILDKIKRLPKPSLIILWMRLAWVPGSSRLNPDARREVSNNSITKSFTDLSFLSASALSFRDLMMEWSGLISRCFLAAMYPIVLESRSAWAFMILSMLADQPYWLVTIQQGDVTRRLDTATCNFNKNCNETWQLFFFL